MPKFEGDEPRKIWQRFFAEQKPSPAEVAETVKLLHQERQHEQTIACIETALISADPQPWMYEVLALSMELAGRPKEDVERVLLSRVDFTAALVPELLLSAAYLKRLGFDQRALTMYQQASRLAPTRPEPYVLGLRIARESNDPDGVAWAATGVLTNVWQNRYEVFHKEAEDTALVVEENLRKSGRDVDAEKLKTAVAAAHQRDLMLTLTWSGDADLDLSVEEPNGTVCSFENPFTTGGGAYTHDGYGPKSDHCFEEYVCASALPGSYVIRVRAISGETVGRRAELKIRRYVGSEDSSEKIMTIPIDGNDKVIRLSLNEGRRTALSEKPVSSELAGRRPSNDDPSGQTTVLRQFAGSGNQGASRNLIGFRPTITTIPDGVGLSAMAVVSGDRRYVKMSLAPIFQQVIEVNTFSIPGR